MHMNTRGAVIATNEDRLAKNYSAAIERVQELARVRQVDGWYTCDHTH
jgi:hypothetical protein